MAVANLEVYGTLRYYLQTFAYERYFGQLSGFPYKKHEVSVPQNLVFPLEVA